MPKSVPDMRKRASVVTSNATCRWNDMLFAELNVDIPEAAIAVATKHRARRASGCHPPCVESGTGKNCTLLPASWTIPAYLETFAALTAFKMFRFCTASRIRAWLSGWQTVTSNRSVPRFLHSVRISGLSLCLPRGLSSTIGRYQAVQQEAGPGSTRGRGQD